jgi:hypothetical protein
MGKWIIYAVVILGGGYLAYDYYRTGLHTRPELPEGAFSLSYPSGFRAIMVGVPNMKHERRYLGVDFEVPRWFQKAWSFCSVPSTAERAKAENLGPGSRLEAICRIKGG